MDDDFNFVGGLVVMFELVKYLWFEGNKLKFEGFIFVDLDLL